MVVEDHDGGDHAAGHHEHDAVEVGSCNTTTNGQLIPYWSQAVRCTDLSEGNYL